MIGDLHPSSTHPPLPPTTEDIRFSHLRLLRSSRVGPSTYHRLIAAHGSAEAALQALPQIAAEAGLPNYEICPEPVIAAELKAGRKARATLLVYGHAGYPAALMDHPEAPPLLWALGALSLLDRPPVALTGAQNASALGMRTATAFARDLTQADHVVVAGLGRGIDAAAHKAAREQGSIAVHPGGLDVALPADTADLAAQVARDGLRLSEAPLGTEAQARHFPAQGRLIAGLGLGCVLIEAALKSGSLAIARAASDLGREVMAVPGHPFDARAGGSNALIRDGATLVRGAQDVIEALAPLSPPIGAEKLAAGTPVTARLSDLPARTTPPEADSHALHGEILRQLGPDPVALDQLIRNLRARPDNLGAVLAELEMTGRIRRHAGGLLSRCA